MPLPITALYAALLCAVGIVLQQLVGRERLRAGVSIGDGGDPGLSVAMRRQGPFGLRVDDMRVRARFVGAFGTLLVMIAEIGTAGRQALAG